jgi:hypothetical protein
MSAMGRFPTFNGKAGTASSSVFASPFLLAVTAPIRGGGAGAICRSGDLGTVRVHALGQGPDDVLLVEHRRGIVERALVIGAETAGGRLAVAGGKCEQEGEGSKSDFHRVHA